MARVKRGTKRKKRVKKVMDRSEGFVLGRNNIFRRAVEAVRRADVYAYRDRRQKKREFRRLWITRIAAAAKLNGVSYSRLVESMTKTNVGLNRKMLSEIAIHDPKGFQAIVNEVRS